MNANEATFMQPDITRGCVLTIERYRAAQNVPVESLTGFIEDQSGVPLNFYQWRAIRNGMAKMVPVHVIILAAQFLNIPAHELFPTLDA